MAEKEVFNNLVTELSEAERKKMLDQLNLKPEEAWRVSAEAEAGEDGSMSGIRRELGLLERLIIFFKSIFSNHSKKQLEEQYLLDKIIRDQDKKYAKYFSLERGEFYPSFSEEVLNLCGSWMPLAELIYTAGENKPEFIGYLFEKEIPDSFQELIRETDPAELEERLGSGQEPVQATEVRLAMENSRERIFGGIGGAEKNKLYGMVKDFYALDKLLSLPFEKVVKPFSSSGGFARGCSVTEAKPALEILWEALKNFRLIPEEKTLKRIFEFARKKSFWETEVNNTASGAEAFAGSYRQAYSQTKQFRDRFDMDNLLRTLKRNLNYSPKLSPLGGEEWFALLKRFFEDENQERFTAYQKEKKQKVLIEGYEKLTGQRGFQGLRYYSPVNLGRRARLPYQLAASFAEAFMRDCYPSSVEPLLQIIRGEGSFYKEKNRSELKSSMEGLEQMTSRIREFDRAFAEGGVYYEKLEGYLEYKGSPGSFPELENFYQKIGREIHSYLFEFFTRLDILTNVLEGILFGQSGGRYDSLSNFKQIGGTNNSRVITSLHKNNDLLKGFSELLHETADMEKRQGN